VKSEKRAYENHQEVQNQIKSFQDIPFVSY